MYFYNPRPKGGEFLRWDWIYYFISLSSCRSVPAAHQHIWVGILFHLGVNRSIVALKLDRLDLLLQCLEDVEQRWNDHNLAEHTDEHTTYGCRSECHVSVVAYAPWHEQWQQTDDHGERSHQDRTQTAEAPSTADHEMAIPVRRRSRANCTIRMAFLARSPISMMSAICM